MHRSSSTSTRASDELLLHGLGMDMGSTPVMSNCTGGQGALLDYSSHLLPKYDPQSEYSAKKEAARARSSSRAIHLIPLVLIACAVVLWFFSSPRVVGMTIKADSVVIAGIDNTTIQRLINNGTQVKKLEVGGALAAATAAAEGTSTSTNTAGREEQVNGRKR